MIFDLKNHVDLSASREISLEVESLQIFPYAYGDKKDLPYMLVKIVISLSSKYLHRFVLKLYQS